MKTDLVLTMDQYLNAWCVAPRVKAPTRDARHIPITTEGDVNLHPKKRACRCDRWGHPCVDCNDNGKVR
jgi:hypothetical protein